MASHRLSVFTQEELAEQARSVFASRARAVPPPARSAPLPAQHSPDHLCRLGSPHPGYHRATSPALAPPERIPQDPPPLVCTKAASLLTSHCGAPGIPGESWDSAQPLGQHPRVLHTPRWRGGGACRARVIQRPPHNISPISYTNESLCLQISQRSGWNAPADELGTPGRLGTQGAEHQHLLGRLLLPKPQNLPQAKAEAPEPALELNWEGTGCKRPFLAAAPHHHPR